jgi:hypothetical protein
MVIRDDLPLVIKREYEENQAIKHHEQSKLEARLLLREIEVYSELLNKLSIEWAPHAMGEEKVNIKKWLRAQPQQTSVASFVHTIQLPEWQKTAGKVALSIMEGEALASHICFLVSNGSLDWYTIRKLLTQSDFMLVEYITEAINERAKVDANLKSELVKFLASCPDDAEFWTLSYVGKKAVHQESKAWRMLREEGRLDYSHQFVPTIHSPIPLIALLADWNRGAFFTTIDKLPFPQVIEFLLDYCCSSTSILLSILGDIPFLPEPRIHGAFPITLKKALDRVSEIRTHLEMRLRSTVGADSQRSVESAIEAVSAWRDAWIRKVVEILQKRPDAERCIPQILAQLIDKALSLDARERYCPDYVADKLAMIVEFTSILGGIPDPLWERSNHRDIEGTFASLLLEMYVSTEKSAESCIEQHVADSLWERFISMLPENPSGLYWGVTTPRPLENWMNVTLASVLFSTTDLLSSWQDAWASCASQRTIMRRDDNAVRENVIPSVLLIYIGWIAIGKIGRNSTVQRAPREGKLREILVEDSIALLATTPYANIVLADRGFKVSVIITNSLLEPERTSSLLRLMEYASPDPELTSWIENVLAEDI